MKLAVLLKKLRAVQAVAEVGHTVGAASRLHLSQSAVVRAIQDVETAIACQIFDRSARGMQPTPLGTRLIERIERALTLLAQVDAEPSAQGEARGGIAYWHKSRLAASAGFRHLQTFLALAASSDMKAAASTLVVSLPAVYQALNQLNHLAGHALYQRGQNGVRLTEAGERAQRYFKLALAELAQADEEISIQHGALRANIVIGTLPFSTGLFLPQALEQVLSQYPRLQVTVIDGTYETLLHKLRCAEIDLIVGALRKQPPVADVVQEALFEDTLCVVGHPRHPLAQHQLHGLRDLSGASWIMPMAGTPAQAAFDEAFQAEGLHPPEASLRVNSPTLIQAMLATSERLALMSSRQARQEVQAGHLHILPVSIRHAPRHIGITSRHGFLPSPASQMLLEAIRTAARDMRHKAPPESKN